MGNNLDQYINKIYRGLKLPNKIKRHIKADLTSEIYSRIENGEELNDILSSIGSPEEVIAEFESNHESEYFQFKKTKVLMLIVWSVIAVIMVVLILYSLIEIIYPQWAFSPVFGGANGNQAVFIAFKWPLKELVFGLIVKAVIFIISLSQVIRHIKFSKGNKDVRSSL